MLNKKIKPLRKGQVITAEFLNSIVDQLNNLGGLTVAGGNGSGISWIGGKPIIKPGVSAEQVGFFARITEVPDWVNGKYSWRELETWIEPSGSSLGRLTIGNNARLGAKDNEETCLIEASGFRFLEKGQTVFVYPPSLSIPYYWCSIPYWAQVVFGKNMPSTGATVHSYGAGGFIGQEGANTQQVIQLTSNTDYFLTTNKNFTAVRMPTEWNGNKNNDVYWLLNQEC